MYNAIVMKASLEIRFFYKKNYTLGFEIKDETTPKDKNTALVYAFMKVAYYLNLKIKIHSSLNTNDIS